MAPGNTSPEPSGHGFADCPAVGARRPRQWRHLRTDGAGPGAGFFRDPGDLHPPGRVRGLWRADHGHAARRAHSAHAVAAAGAGRRGAGGGNGAPHPRPPPPPPPAPPVHWPSTLLWCVALPLLACALVWLPGLRPALESGLRPAALEPGLRPVSLLYLHALTTLVLIAPLGPLLYRLAFRPLADASVLMLLIVAVALHGVLVGLGLLFFGAEGARTPAFVEARWAFGGMAISGQSLVVLGVTLALLGLLLILGRSMVGKALRATAINRVGARLMGIPTERSAELSFALAALIGAVSGLLIAPLTTVYYDTGFLIGLKGFVAAIVGALASYPLALAGALLVGQLEAFASFWASAYKEVLVFTLIVPVLWWRSLPRRLVEDEE